MIEKLNKAFKMLEESSSCNVQMKQITIFEIIERADSGCLKAPVSALSYYSGVSSNKVFAVKGGG